MDLTIFDNHNTYKISVEQAKKILNRNGNAHSQEEVKKIVYFLYALAEPEVGHQENQNQKRSI